jgi:Mg2+-importing ATPase
MISFSVILRFSQEYKSMRAAQALRQLVHTTATVKRRDLNKDISPGLAADLGVHLDQGSPQEQEVSSDIEN